MGRHRRDRTVARPGAEADGRRRDRSIAIALAVAATVLLVAARADGRTGFSPDRPIAARTDVGTGAPSARPAFEQHWGANPLPVGWHQVHRRLTDVLVPVQVFAAATYPIVLHHPPGGCGPPRAVLAEMPPGGVLLQVIEYPPRAPDGHPITVPRLPRRPARFTWADGPWARYECAGPSFKFDYRQAGHALQAQVWMSPATADPHLRAGALRILDNLQKERPAN